MTAFKLLTPPAVEPVLLTDAKIHARIDTTADDAFVTSLITGARQWVERYTGRALITQSWQLWLDQSPGGDFVPGERQGPVSSFSGAGFIELPYSPLQSVTSVAVYDNTDTAANWDVSNYFVDTIRAPGRLALRTGASWPLPGRLTNGICITYVCGYGADGSTVPEVIKTAIRQLIAHWYENRGEAATAPTTRGGVISPSIPMPLVVQALLDPYRVRPAGVL